MVSETIDYEGLPQSESFASHLVAGALAGVAEHAVMYPIDSIKTRMQVISPSSQAVYSGVVHAISRISSTEGARTLWRGVTSVIMGAGPAHALYFATYEEAKSVFEMRSSNTLLAHGAAGACATVASDALMNPFDVVKQRMQVHGSTYRTPLDCFMRVLRAEGLRAFYVSYPTTLAMTVPFQSIQFATYEYFRRLLNPKGNYDPMTHVLAGGLAGALAAGATTPLDATKTLLQTRGESEPHRGVSGMREAMATIHGERGFRGFFRGVGPRVLTHTPSTAICWSVYEYFKYVIYRGEGSITNSGPG